MSHVPKFLAFTEKPLYILMEYVDWPVLDIKALTDAAFYNFMTKAG